MNTGLAGNQGYHQTGTEDQGSPDHEVPNSAVVTNHCEPMVLPDTPQLLERKRKRFLFDEIVSQRFPLEKNDEAFHQSEQFGRRPCRAAVTRDAIDRRISGA